MQHQLLLVQNIPNSRFSTTRVTSDSIGPSLCCCGKDAIASVAAGRFGRHSVLAFEGMSAVEEEEEGAFRMVSDEGMAPLAALIEITL